MVTPKINANLSQPFAILAGSVVLSYFSHIGWWSLAGFFFVLGAFFNITGHIRLGDICLALSGILFIIAVVAMRWFWF